MANFFKNIFKPKTEEKEPQDNKIEKEIDSPKDKNIEENQTTKETEVEDKIENKDDIDTKEKNDTKGLEEVESEGKEEKELKQSILSRFKIGLKKTSDQMGKKLDDIFTKNVQIDEDMYEELEEILITSDISFDTTIKIIDKLKENIDKKKIKDASLVKDELKNVLYELFEKNDNNLELKEKTVLLIVGVNGVGKTTTIGKLATMLGREGKKVLIVAGDTFRAAAVEQLEIWADRSGADLVKNEKAKDPSAVVYDGIQKFKAGNYDVLICDTAGRLHNKKNLMEELSKINRIIDKQEIENRKNILIIDATTGQNALSQVNSFNEIVPLDGIIMTKLDGSAKGGVVISTFDSYNIPIKYVGLGEGIDDLQKFEAKEFVDSIIV